MIDNLRYTYPCMISILIGPVSLWLLIYCVLEKGFQIPKWVDTISYIFMFEALVFTMFLFIIVTYRMPPKWYDVYRLKKKIFKLNTSDGKRLTTGCLVNKKETDYDN